MTTSMNTGLSFRTKSLATITVVSGAATLVGLHSCRDLGCSLPKVSPDESLRESLAMDQLESALSLLPTNLTSLLHPEGDLRWKRFRSWQESDHAQERSPQPDRNPLGEMQEVDNVFGALGYILDVDSTDLPTTSGEHILDLASQYIEIQGISTRFTGDIVLAEALREELARHSQLFSRYGSSSALTEGLNQKGTSAREMLLKISNDRATQLIISEDFERLRTKTPKMALDSFVIENRELLTPDHILTSFTILPTSPTSAEGSVSVSTLVPFPVMAPISDAALGLLHLGEASLRGRITLSGKDICSSDTDTGISAYYELRLVPNMQNETVDSGILLWSGEYSTAPDSAGYSNFVLDYADYIRTANQDQKVRLPIVFSGAGITDEEALNLYINTWSGRNSAFYQNELRWTPVEFEEGKEQQTLERLYEQKVREREVTALKETLEENNREVYTLRVLANINGQELPVSTSLEHESAQSESLAQTYLDAITPITSFTDCPSVFEYYHSLAGSITDSFHTLDQMLTHELRGRNNIYEETGYDHERSLHPAWGKEKGTIYLGGHLGPWKYRKYHDPNAIFPDGAGLLELRTLQESLGVSFKTCVGVAFLEGLENADYKPFYQASLVLSQDDIGKTDQMVPMSLRGELQLSAYANGISFSSQLLTLARTGVADIYIQAPSEEVFRAFQEEQRLEREVVHYMERHPVVSDYFTMVDAESEAPGLFSFGSRFGQDEQQTLKQLLADRPPAVPKNLEERGVAVENLRQSSGLEENSRYTVYVVFTDKSARPGHVITLTGLPLHLLLTDFSSIPNAVALSIIREKVNRDGDGDIPYSLGSYKEPNYRHEYYTSRAYGELWMQTELTDQRSEVYTGELLPPWEASSAERSDIFAKELSRYFREKLNCYWDRFK